MLPDILRPFDTAVRVLYARALGEDMASNDEVIAADKASGRLMITNDTKDAGHTLSLVAGNTAHRIDARTLQYDSAAILPTQERGTLSFTEESIQRALHEKRPILSQPRWEAFNMFLYGWESDFLAFSRNGYLYEAEIKVSRGDFLADLKNKKAKHRIMKEAFVRRGMGKEPVPNYFYYVCPEGIVSPEDIERIPYAGLIWISEKGRFNSKRIAAPIIHPKKYTDMFPPELLAEKFHWAAINMARRYWKKDVKDISSATRASYEKTIMMYDDMLSERVCEIDELKGLLKKAGINH